MPTNDMLELTKLVERLALLVGEMAWGNAARMQEATAIRVELGRLRETRTGKKASRG